jgi:acetolactate synthase-1/2/3 large subunit
VATSNRPGPVIIEVPDDVFSSSAFDEPHSDGLSGCFPRVRTAPDPDCVVDAALLLARSRHPMILAGGGVHISGACPEVLTLAEKLSAPVATTISGKGSISEHHPLAVGVVGSFGSTVANDTVSESDCLVVVGCKLGQMATLGWELPEPASQTIHVDIDAEEIGRNFSRSLPLQADARLGLRALLMATQAEAYEPDWDLDSLRKRVEDFWATDTFKSSPVEDRIKPQHVMRELAERLCDDDVVVTDASLSSGWAASRWRLAASGRRLVAPRGMAGLGWGLPAAIGVAFAMRDIGRPGRVVCLAGDGGWGYSVSEIETLARFNVALPSIVLNNATLAWNKHGAMTRYPDAWVSQDFTDVSWSDAGVALGAWGARVTDPNEVGAALDRAFGQSDGPSVVEVISSEDETPVIKMAAGAVPARQAAY